MLIRSPWLVLYALALQALAVVTGWPQPAVVALHASSYVVALVFLWLNRATLGRALRRVRQGRGSPRRGRAEPAPVRDRRVIIPDQSDAERRRPALAFEVEHVPEPGVEVEPEVEPEAEPEPASDLRYLEPHA